MWFEDVAALVGNVRRYSCCICWVVELGKWLKRWRLCFVYGRLKSATWYLLDFQTQGQE